MSRRRFNQSLAGFRVAVSFSLGNKILLNRLESFEWPLSGTPLPQKAGILWQNIKDISYPLN